MQPRDTVVIDVEVLADQIAQQPVRVGDALVVKQPVSPLDGTQRALGVLRDTRQHPLALGLLTPATIGLVVGLGVVEIQAVIEALPRTLIDGRDRVEQLLDAVANQPDGVLRGRRAEHRRRVDDLLDRALKQPDLLGQPERRLQRHSLLAMQQQPRAVLRQRRRMPALVIDREPKRDLPPQIPRDRLHRRLIRQAGPVLQQQHLRQQRRRDRRASHPSRVARSEVLITHDPVTVLGQQRVKRALRQRPRQQRRIEHPNLSRPCREHPAMVLNPPDGNPTISGVF